jgi:hypothetical protein
MLDAGVASENSLYPSVAVFRAQVKLNSENLPAFCQPLREPVAAAKPAS